ncbi:molybdopterin converting factor small subunit [Catenuloplanes nepalensis]|uniref:Molybdopterin converting factor small subunit n=1 Tax=Catenuloplanes nepalensis TaxID=587533 RepID=A0ABT9N4E1_9ACTN|nr:MoaD/ThiS family protein [Catenuloplanes nepalensis]MDP9798557.1 molybdopterin converting factor small subunit [Catenuloplanes nepalensis]
MKITIRYFAAARAAAGTSEEVLDSAAATLEALLAELATRHGDRLTSVFARASYLVDGAAWRDRTAALPSDPTVDVLPPFAGG